MASRSKKIGMETSLPASPARQYSDEEYMDALVVARQRRDEGDIQDLFRLILASPVKPGEKMVEVDGKVFAGIVTRWVFPETETEIHGFAVLLRQ